MNNLTLVFFLAVLLFQFVLAETTLDNRHLKVEEKLQVPGLQVGEDNNKIICEQLSNCADCVESGCKFCNGLGCVPSEATQPCERGYIHSPSTDRECPSGNKGDGVSLAPFACFIVLFSFLISIM